MKFLNVPCKHIMESFIVIASAVTLLYPAAATRAAGDSAEIIFPEHNNSVEIPVELFTDIIYLPVTINGSHHCDLALDTGAAGLSALDSGLAARLGLRLKDAGTAGGAGPERVQTSTVMDVKLEIAGIQMKDPRWRTLPLKRMEPFWGHTMNGLLGGNFLSRLVFRIDYRRKTVTFFKPESFHYTGPGTRIPLELVSGTPLIRAGVIHWP